jgi:hypothetical protein
MTTPGPTNAPIEQERSMIPARIPSPRSRSRLAPFLAASALVLAPGVAPQARGAFVLVSPDVQAAPGTSGTFDITVTNTNIPGGGDFDVNSFFVELALPGLPGVHFNGVTISTVTPYIFTSSGTLQPGADPFSTDTFPNTGFIASDSEFGPLGSRTVTPGAVFGVAHVSYSVDPGVLPGGAPLSFGGATSASDSVGGLIPFGTVVGDFTVLPVPEPSSLVLMASGSALVVLAGIRRRSRKATGHEGSAGRRALRGRPGP